ncbi:MAG: hypothetical protein NVS2B14_02150 [Chamaesiphon sp.]
MTIQQSIKRISEQTIEESKQYVDIVDVISEKVALCKIRKNLMGCYPFHEEKILSFGVSPTKQMYYCFGGSARSAQRRLP